MADTTYNRIIRKLVVGFGNLFDNITLVRYNPDYSEQERFLVPLTYATKEKYVMRLQGDPELDKKVQITLPRMSFEMTGINYDASRKQNTNIKNFAQTASGVVSQYMPVPYNFDFSLSIYVRNIEDGTQIIEHILPFFTPDYTIKLNLIPEMGIVKEIPVVLNGTDYDIQYEGNRESDTRIIIWTLNFTVKGFIFGKTTTAGLIKTSITNIYNDSDIYFIMANTGTGIYQTGEIAYQGYSLPNALATGKVQSWSNTTKELVLTETAGNFISTSPIIGASTHASRTFIRYKTSPMKYANVIITPNPATANADSNYTYNIAIYETGNSGIKIIK